MTDLHHRRSIRLKEFDYTAPGAYFVTIVTFERRNLFGEILPDLAEVPVVLLNNAGLIVQREWERLPTRFPGISLDKFIVMPNHLHGIIVIEANRRGTGVNSRSNGPGENPRAPTGNDLDMGRGTGVNSRSNGFGETPRAPTGNDLDTGRGTGVNSRSNGPGETPHAPTGNDLDMGQGTGANSRSNGLGENPRAPTAGNRKNTSDNHEQFGKPVSGSLPPSSGPSRPPLLTGPGWFSVVTQIPSGRTTIMSMSYAPNQNGQISVCILRIILLNGLVIRKTSIEKRN
jgi:hypothetical protein